MCSVVAIVNIVLYISKVLRVGFEVSSQEKL